MLDAGGTRINAITVAQGPDYGLPLDQLKGQALAELPFLASRFDHLRLTAVSGHGAAAPRGTGRSAAARRARHRLGAAARLPCRTADLPACCCSCAPRAWTLGREHPAAAETDRHQSRHGPRAREGRDAARRTSKSASRSAAAAANDGLWDFNVERNELYLSPRWKAMLGYDDSDWGPVDWRGLIHPEDMTRVQESIRNHLAGTAPLFDSVHRMRHSNGEYRWVISRAKARVDKDGRLKRLVGVELDITERKTLRGSAVPREGERADHAAVDRRRRHHHRRRVDHRLHQSGGRAADRLAPRGCDGQAGRRGVPRLPRGNLRAAREPADCLDPAHAPDQGGAAGAADPPRRQRTLCREHGRADPRRPRQGLGRRAGVP